MSYLLDTCVISEMVARQQHTRVLAWVDSRDEMSLYLSAITIGEIGKGIEKLPGSLRRAICSNGCTAYCYHASVAGLSRST